MHQISPPSNKSSPPIAALWLVPTPLDFGTGHATALDAVLPQEVMQQAAGISHWVVENAKTARAVLGRIQSFFPLAVTMQQMQITELPRQVHKKGDAGFDAQALLRPALEGYAIGLMSEAGLPAVADPGASVVRAAHALGIAVRPLVGPSSLMLALMATGLNGQNFAFVGYLPVASGERERRIRELETIALRTGQTQLFIETPYRNEALMHTLLSTLRPSTRLAVACGLTLPQGWQMSTTASVWKKVPQRSPEQWALPAVFAIGQ